MVSNEHPDMSGNPSDMPLVCEMCGTEFSEDSLCGSRNNGEVLLCSERCVASFDARAHTSLPSVWCGQTAEEWAQKSAAAFVELEKHKKLIQSLQEQAELDRKNLREALEPVEFWFDLDGEEYDQVPLVEAVSESIKMLVADRDSVIRLREAICKLQRGIGDHLATCDPADKPTFEEWIRFIEETLKEQEQ